MRQIEDSNEKGFLLPVVLIISAVISFFILGGFRILQIDNDYSSLGVALQQADNMAMAGFQLLLSPLAEDVPDRWNEIYAWDGSSFGEVAYPLPMNSLSEGIAVFEDCRMQLTSADTITVEITARAASAKVKKRGKFKLPLADSYSVYSKNRIVTAPDSRIYGNIYAGTGLSGSTANVAGWIINGDEVPYTNILNDGDLLVDSCQSVKWAEGENTDLAYDLQEDDFSKIYFDGYDSVELSGRIGQNTIVLVPDECEVVVGDVYADSTAGNSLCLAIVGGTVLIEGKTDLAGKNIRHLIIANNSINYLRDSGDFLGTLFLQGNGDIILNGSTNIYRTWFPESFLADLGIAGRKIIISGIEDVNSF